MTTNPLAAPPARFVGQVRSTSHPRGESGRVSRRALLVAGAAVCSGCALTPFVRLSSNLDQLDQLAAVHGQVLDSSGQDAAATVVALRPDAAGWRFDSAAATYEGRFLLRVQPGVAYTVLAFADPGSTRRMARDSAFALATDWTAGRNGQADPRTLVLRADPAGVEASMQAALGNLADVPMQPLPVSIGRRATLDHPMFDASVASMGLWAPAEFLSSVGGGVYLLQPHTAGRLPVLLVHGVAGSPRDLAPVIEAIDPARVEPWVFHYPSGLRLDSAATMLAGIVAELTPRLGLTRLAIVAHSMGGLVAMAAVRQLAQRVPALRVPLMATVASPWGGHGAASWGVKFAPTAIPSWVDMQPGSPFLAALQSAEARPGLRHHLYFAYKGRGDDGTITLASQLVPAVQRRAARVRGFDADHTSVLSDPGLLDELRASTLQVVG